ncbi:CRISPR-associated endoribonuclease Cas6 [Marichromatium purpuratum]|nr:CRISPR-associated endoribonuclease Cas6 [Marichromatium purpuratum]
MDMHRVRLQLRPGEQADYRHQDLIHDTLINAWIESGARPDQVIGASAQPWTFAPLGFHNQHQGRAHTLVVSTPSAELAAILAAFEISALRHARTTTGELLDFTSATLVHESPPMLSEQATLGVLTLSPIVIRDRSAPGKRWHTRLDAFDLSAAVNTRLSRIAGREVALEVHPDSLYLRANPRHSVLVSTKRMRNGHSAFVIGMSAPLVLAGSREDLLLAWYTGLGEKTRNGFGCIGLAEDGVGR